MHKKWYDYTFDPYVQWILQQMQDFFPNINVLFYVHKIFVWMSERLAVELY